MIIIIKKSNVNTIAAQKLGEMLNMPVGSFPEQALEKMQGDRLILLDITATGDTQSYLSADYFAKWLIKRGLPQNVTTIDVYVSDIYSEDSSIVTFSYSLCACLRDQHNRHTTVRNIANQDYDYTVLVPPHLNEGKQWEIIGLSAEDIEEKQEVNIEKFINCKNKKVLFQGEEIEEWLNKDIHKHLSENIPLNMGAANNLY